MILRLCRSGLGKKGFIDIFTSCKELQDLDVSESESLSIMPATLANLIADTVACPRLTRLNICAIPRGRKLARHLLPIFEQQHASGLRAEVDVMCC